MHIPGIAFGQIATGESKGHGCTFIAKIYGRSGCYRVASAVLRGIAETGDFNRCNFRSPAGCNLNLVNSRNNASEGSF